MFRQIVPSLKQLAAIACIALACLIVAQAVVAGVDEIAHTLGTEHRADDTGGIVLSCFAESKLCIPSSDAQPISHAHVGDTATVLPLTVAPLIAAQYGLACHRIGECSHGAGVELAVQERPPRA